FESKCALVTDAHTAAVLKATEYKNVFFVRAWLRAAFAVIRGELRRPSMRRLRSNILPQSTEQRWDRAGKIRNLRRVLHIHDEQPATLSAGPKTRETTPATLAPRSAVASALPP